MNILLLGGGGREHALAWRLAQSAGVARIVASPGNPGIAAHAECVALDLADHAAVVALCRASAIDLVVVGPEAPLVDGLADTLRAARIAVFGPSAAAARLEGSKAFAKALCVAHGIPTAAYEHHVDRARALAALDRFALPVVVKADGLAAGKGVTVATTRAEAEAAIEGLFAQPATTTPVHPELVEGLSFFNSAHKSGQPFDKLRANGGGASAAKAEVVIEAFLEGEEVSLFVIADGTDIVAFGSAQDHKRVGDGDTGPNTGGMGAYSPARVLTPALEARAIATIIEPTLAAMRAAGTPFVGVLYAGLMLTPDGPSLIEYNVRLGDPEAQVLLPRFAGDLAQLLLAAATGRLAGLQARFSHQSALTVVVAARGYPATPVAGGAVNGLDRVTDALVFQAGTRTEGNTLVASGGRVLAVTALGDTLAEAHARAYAAVAAIDYADGFTRSDIGWRELHREGNVR